MPAPRLALLLGAAIVSRCSGISAVPTTTPPPFAVAGYLPEWRYQGASFDAMFRHLTHLIFFSIEPLTDGSLSGLDRLPGDDVLAAARAAAAAHGTKLLICLGGNGRSGGFSAASRNRASRARLVRSVVKLVTRLQLDGVDYNWEYPGFTFGTGYSSDPAVVAADWDALAALVNDTRAAFDAAAGGVITLAYYPDGRQEGYLAARGLHHSADLLHAMSYDASGPQHSPMSLAEATVAGAAAAGLAQKVTLGLPFYGRHSSSGDWTTYEDIVQRYHPLDPTVDSVPAEPPGGAAAKAKRKGGRGDAAGPTIGFNGAATIEAKTGLALRSGLAGVMIWESGQDCRIAPVTRGGTTHVRTCPGVGGAADTGDDPASLHAAITRAVRRRGGAAAGGGKREGGGGWGGDRDADGDL